MAPTTAPTREQDAVETQKQLLSSSPPRPNHHVDEIALDNAANQENNDAVEDCINLYDEENFDEVSGTIPFAFYGCVLLRNWFAKELASLEIVVDSWACPFYFA